MKVVLFLNFIYIILAIPAFACEEIDIRDKLSPELKEYFSTPKNQTSTGFCWAYSLADLYAAATGKPISAIDLAVKVMATAERSENNTISVGGDVKKLWLPAHGPDSLLDGGPGFDSEDAHFVLKESKSTLCETKSIPDYTGWLSSHGVGGKFYQLEKIRKAYEIGDDVSEYFPEDCVLGIGSQLKNLSQAEIFQTIAQMHDQLLIKSLQSLFEKACSHKVALPNVTIVSKNPKDKNTEQFIDSSLKSGRPLGVSIPVGEFTNSKNKNSEHALTIIGKKKIDGQCFYTVRNSWGIGCALYKDKYRINCNPKEGVFYLPISRINKLEEILYYDFKD